jgi:hypothetical protein
VDAGDAWAGLGRTSCKRDRPARARPLATAARPLQEHTHAAWVQVPHRLPPWCLSPASSLFDACASRHLKVVEMVVEQANCLVESRHDVVILLAGIARLAPLQHRSPLSWQGLLRRRRTLAVCTEGKVERP